MSRFSSRDTGRSSRGSSRLPSIREIEDDVKDLLETEPHPVIEMYYEEVSRDNYTNREFGELMRWVEDALEYAVAGNARTPYEKNLSVLVLMKAANYILGIRKLADELDDREYDDAQDIVQSAIDLQDAMANAGSRGRGRGRDDREDRGRPGGRFARGGERDRSEGRDYNRNARHSSRQPRESGNSLRSKYREREEREERVERPRTNSERYSREERSQSRQLSVVDTQMSKMDEMKARLRESLSGTAPVASQPVAEMPNPAVVNVPPSERTQRRPAVEFVHTQQPTGRVRNLDPAQVLPKPTNDSRPLTREELLATDANLEDQAFLATLPPVPVTDRPVVPVLYDPTVVRPRLVCTPEGYQDTIYTEVDMNYDDAVIPDLGRPASYDAEVSQVRAQLAKVAATSRFRLADVESDLEHQRQVHNADMAEWEAANKDRPEEERDPMPLFSPEIPERAGDVIMLPGIVNGMGKTDLAVKMWQLGTENEVLADDTDAITIQALCNEMELIYVARTDAEFEDLKQQLLEFTGARWNDGHSYTEYHKRLMDIKSTIAPALWVRINRLFTGAVNRILQGNMGLPCWIDDFGQDGIEFLGRLKEDYGIQTVERLNKFGRELMRQFHCIEFAAGEDNVAVKRGVYHRERFNTLLTGYSAMELGLMSPRLNGKPSRTARVTKETSPLLYKAINGLRQHEGITDELFAIRRRIIMADGAEMEIFVSWYDPAANEYMVRFSS